LDRAAETLKFEREALHAVKTVLENSVAASGVLPESLLSELKTKADATLSGLESAILSPDSGGVEGSTKAIASFEKDRTLKLSALADSVRLAETSLDLAKTGKSQTGTDEKRSLEALEIAVEMKRGELELAKKEAEKSVSGIAAAQVEGGAKTAETGAKVSEAVMARDLAQESAETALLRAPFAGVVLERFFDPGVVVNAGTPVLSVSSPKKMKAEVSFDSKKTPLSEGGELAIRSIKTGKTFTGTLLLVSKTDSVSGSKRKAEVAIPDGMVEIGDRVTVVLSPSSEKSSAENSPSEKSSAENSPSEKTSAAKASNVGVLIPKSAIVTRYSVPAAFVIEGGIARLKTVRVLGTDSQSALVEGIPVGSRIITAGKDSILDGERVGE
jgi:biotin carboxyl carrier protein